MSILDTFYLLFESNADKAKKGVDDLFKSTDKADERLSGMDRHVHQAGARIVDTFKEIGTALAAAFAAHKIAAALSELTEFNAQAGITADRLRLGVAEFEALGDAVAHVGGSREAATATLESINRELGTMATTGQSRLKPLLDVLGVRITDTTGKLKGVLPVLGDVAERFEGMTPERRRWFADGLGIDQGTLLLLASGRRGMDDIIDRQKQLGGVTKEDTEQAHHFEQEWGDLMVSFRSVGTVILSYVLPPLTAVMRGIVEFVSFLRGHGQFAMTFFSGLATVITAAYLPAVIRAAAATWALVAPLLIAAAPFIAIAAAVAAAALVIDDFITYLRGGNSVIGTLINSVPVLGDTIAALGEFFTELGRLIWTVVGKDLAAFGNSFMEVFGAIMRAAPGLETAVHRIGDVVKGVLAGLKDFIGWIAGGIDTLVKNIERAVALLPGWIRGGAKGLAKTTAAVAAAGAIATSPASPAIATTRPPIVAAGAIATSPASPAIATTRPPIVAASPSFAPVQADAQKKALAFFQARGWTAEQSAGIVANLMRESSLNSSASGDKGQAYGLAQWHGDRQAAFAAMFGKNIRQSSFDDQLAFVDHELRAGSERNAGNALLSAKTAAEAAAIVARKYERPANVDNEAAIRARIAETSVLMARGRQQISTADAIGAGPAPAAGGKVVNVSVGAVTIHTQAKDAEGVAREVGDRLQKEMRQAVAHFDDGVQA